MAARKTTETTEEVVTKKPTSTRTKKTVQDCENCKNKICLEFNKNNKKERMTTTKKVLWLAWFLFVALLVLEVLGYPVDTPIEIVGGVMATIITSVYLWKARTENRLKIAMSVINDLADKYGIENVVNLISQIVSD